MLTPRPTLRKWGTTWSLIRLFAQGARAPFTPHVFEPAFSYAVACSACRELAKLGELRIVTPGRRGGSNRPPRYFRAYKSKPIGPLTSSLIIHNS